MLAPAEAADGTLWYYGVALSTLLVCISMLLTYKSVNLFFNRQVALLTILLFALFPIHCYYALGIIAEVPAFFCATLGLYGWALLTRNPKSVKAQVFMVLGFLGLLLNRPNAMLFLPLVALVLTWAYWRRREYFTRYFKPLVVTLSIVFVVGFGILKGAKAISGQGDSQDELLYYVAHQGRFQFRDEPLNFNFWDNDFREGTLDYTHWKSSNKSLHAVMKAENRTYQDVFSQWLIRDALDHPFFFIRQSLIKVLFGHVYFINSVSPDKFSMGPLKGSAGYSVVLLGINLVNLLILAGVIVYAFREKSLATTWPLWGLWMVLILFHALTYMEPRYLLPAKAALYPLSAAGLYSVPPVRRWMRKLSEKFKLD